MTEAATLTTSDDMNDKTIDQHAEVPLMKPVPPRSSDGAFMRIDQIYYGTDDGFAELRPREEPRHDEAHVKGLYEIFARYEAFYRGVTPVRRDNIHLASVVGGLYGLNLIPLFQPTEITFFDINVHAVAFFELIRRVWIETTSADEFLDALKRGEYEVESEQDRIIRDCISARQNGTLTDDRGQSARSLRSSWRYALDRFDLTRKLLLEVPVRTRVEGMQSQSFRDFVAEHENLWIFCSNVMLFSYFDLPVCYPQNTALFASYFDKTEMLDLGQSGEGPVMVHCRIPMSVTT